MTSSQGCIEKEVSTFNHWVSHLLLKVDNKSKPTFGQKNNFNKSKVSSSKNVEDSRILEIHTMFGVREVAKHEKYLYLLMLISRSK